jgi:ABC-type transporter Mla subunit MlaD
MKIAVGIFTFFTLLFLSFAIFFILKYKGMFDKKYTYAFYANSAENFDIGTPIKYSGFQIGYINKINFTYDGKVFVHFLVKEKNTKWINRRAYLLLRKPLLGGSTISLIANANYPVISPNAILSFDVQDDINSLILELKPVLKNVKDVIANVDKLTLELANPQGSLMKTMGNFEKVSAKFANNKSMLDAITGEKKSTKNITQSIESLKESMLEVEKLTVKVNKILDEVDKGIIKPSQKIPNNINDILEDVKQKLKSLNNLVNAVGKSDKDIIVLKEQILLGVDKVNELVNGVNSLLEKDVHKVDLP